MNASRDGVSATKTAAILRAVLLVAAGAARWPTVMPKRRSRSTTAIADAASPAWYESLYSGGMSEQYKDYMSTECKRAPPELFPARQHFRADNPGSILGATGGFEKRGDQALFEKLSLEGAQAGLSWSTILQKREGYRHAFHNFDIRKCAAMREEYVAALLDSDSATVVRHRGKLESVINNAQRVLELISEAEASGAPPPRHGHFDAFLWSFVDGRPQLNEWKSKEAIPTTSPVAQAMSATLKQRGFKFVGPTCCYSLMQSCGLIIDHPVNTPEWEAARLRLDSAAHPTATTVKKKGKQARR